MSERWLPVVGFESQYEVSDLGNVRRSGRAARWGNGRGGGARVGRQLKLQKLWSGYQTVQLWRDGQPFNRLVHRLVADAFLGARPDDHEVNHRDGVKTNNARTNLEWVTRSENMTHGYATGLYQRPTGTRHPRAKTTLEQVHAVRFFRSIGMRRADVVKATGVTYWMVKSISLGGSWRDVA